MSRLTGADAYSLMEAYNNVYAPQEITEEQVWEEVETWVNSLLEEGYDLSDYTWEEMYEAYIEEKSAGEFYSTPGNRPKPKGEVINLPKVKGAITGGDVTLNRGYASTLGGQKGEVTYQKKDNVVTRSFRPTGMSDIRGSDKPGSNTPATTPTTKPAITPATTPATKPASTPRPAATAPTGGKGKVAPTKPAAATQTGDKAKDMATFASTPANKGLAAAAAEKARIRGTQQTDNPLMKSMKSRLPMNSPSVQAPAVSNLGKGNQSLSQNPNAFKAAPPKPAATSTPAPTSAVKPVTPAAAVSAAPSNSAATSGSLAPATAKVATKPSSAMSQDSIRARRLNMEMEYDAYDLVLEYLLSEGHADTVEEAHYVMIEMDAETIGSIIEEEERRDPRGRVSSGPMNVYRKPEGKPSQAHLDAVAAHRESEKKKSPEQKKKELDDYIQRQRENK